MKQFFAICLSLGVICGAFFYSAQLREESLGRFAYDKNGGGDNTNWVNLSYYSLMFAKNWEMRGAGNMNFLLLNRPYSLELGRWTSSYQSFSPFYLLPYYAILKITGQKASAKNLMQASLVLHLLTILLLLGIFWNLLRVKWKILLILASSCVGIFAAPMLFFYQTIYWPDYVGFLPSLVALFSYIKYTKAVDATARKFWNFSSNIFIFFSVLCDWFGLILAFWIFYFRWLRGEKSTENIYNFWKAPLAALFFFFLHTIRGEGFLNLGNKILERSGISSAENLGFFQYWKGFWVDTLSRQLGYSTFVLLTIAFFLLCVGSFLKEPKNKAVFQFTKILSLTVLVHACIFLQHYYHHSYNSFRVVFTLILILFILFPLCILTITQRWKQNFFIEPIVAATFLIFALLYAKQGVLIFQQKEKVFALDESKNMQKIAEFIGGNTKFSDVVFSDHAYIDPLRTTNSTLMEFSAIAYKYIYQAKDMDDLVKRIMYFKSKYAPPSERVMRVWIFSEGALRSYWEKYTDSSKTIQRDGYRLSYISEERILQFLDEEAQFDSYSF